MVTGAKSRRPHQVPRSLAYYTEPTYISQTILAPVPCPTNMHTPFFFGESLLGIGLYPKENTNSRNNYWFLIMCKILDLKGMKLVMGIIKEQNKMGN